MIIKSITMLSDSELNKIRGILKESKCINESLRATFPHTYSHIDEDKNIIYFGAHSWDFTYSIDPIAKE